MTNENVVLLAVAVACFVYAAQLQIYGLYKYPTLKKIVFVLDIVLPLLGFVCVGIVIFG
jgi:hypothetical protein